MGLWFRHPALMLRAFLHATLGDENRAVALIREAQMKEGLL